MAAPKAGKYEDPQIVDLINQAKLLEAQVAVAELRARFYEANVRAKKAAAEYTKIIGGDRD